MKHVVTALERIEPCSCGDDAFRIGVDPGWYKSSGSRMVFVVDHLKEFCRVLRDLRVSQLLNEKAAFEALIVADDEAVIGPVMCAELATDFVVWDSDATAYVFDYPPGFPGCFGKDGWEWLETYRHFARGLELAGKGGVLIIRKDSGEQA